MIDEFKLISKAIWLMLCDVCQGISKACLAIVRKVTLGDVGIWIVRIFFVLLMFAIAAAPGTLIMLGVVHNQIHIPSDSAFIPLIVMGCGLWFFTIFPASLFGVCEYYAGEKREREREREKRKRQRKEFGGV